MRNRNFRNQESRRPETSNISIPPAHILQGYEDVAPGSTDKILDIVKKEQTHRHKIETENLYLYHRSTRLGQILAFALAILAIVYSKHLFQMGMHDLAKTIPIGLFSFYSIVAIVSAISKSGPKRSKKYKHFKKK